MISPFLNTFPSPHCLLCLSFSFVVDNSSYSHHIRMKIDFRQPERNKSERIGKVKTKWDHANFTISDQSPLIIFLIWNHRNYQIRATVCQITTIIVISSPFIRTDVISKTEIYTWYSSLYTLNLTISFSVPFITSANPTFSQFYMLHSPTAWPILDSRRSMYWTSSQLTLFVAASPEKNTFTFG